MALAKHESSPHRVMNLEETYRKLGVMNLKQDDLFRQAMRCCEVQVYRGAHVLGWAALIDYLQDWLASDGFAALLLARPNWAPIASVEDLQERFTEFQIIEAMRASRFISKNMEKALKGFLSIRNECAHPSTFYPDLNATLGYLSQLLIRLEQLDKTRNP